MKRMLLVGMFLCAAVAVAKPAAKDLKSAQALIDDLMSADLAELKAGKKTAVQIAEAEVGYAEKADTDAAKYILYGSSVGHFAADGEYDRAASALDSMAGLDRVSDDDLLEVATKALKKAKKNEGGALRARLSGLQNRKRAHDNVKKLQVLLRKDSENSTVRTRLAEAYVAADEWDKALDEFTKIVDDVGKVAKWELKKEEGTFDAYKVGDFWWEYAEKKKGDAAKPYKVHAAKWYQEAVAAGQVTGLKKELVERKLAEVSSSASSVGKDQDDKRGDSSQSDATPVDASGSNQPNAKLFPIPDGKMSKSDKGYVLELPDEQKISFLRVPPGKFRSGFREDKSKTLQVVEITRQFWMTEDYISMRQWGKGLKQEGVDWGEAKWHWEDDKKKHGDPWRRYYGISEWNDQWKDLPVWRRKTSDIKEVCRQLTEKYRNDIPKGYVVRLPTNAEWEYVFKNITPQYNEVLHVRTCNLDVFLASALAPHQWGFKHIAGAPEGSPGEGLIVMDCLGPDDLKGDGDSRKPNWKRKLPDLKRDPLWYYDGADGWNLLANQWYVKDGGSIGRWLVTFVRGGGWRRSGIRLVIGPDLVREWKAKNGKK